MAEDRDSQGSQSIIIHKAKPGDDRDFIRFHAIACRRGDFHYGPAENEEMIYTEQDRHYTGTGHTAYWHYTIERSRSRIVNPAKGQW